MVLVDAIIAKRNLGTRKDQAPVVIAVGPGKVNDKGEVNAMNVKKGETVLFGKYSGTEVKVDGEELVVMREDDIMAVIEG